MENAFVYYIVHQQRFDDSLFHQTLLGRTRTLRSTWTLRQTRTWCECYVLMMMSSQENRLWIFRHAFTCEVTESQYVTFAGWPRHTRNHRQTWTTWPRCKFTAFLITFSSAVVMHCVTLACVYVMHQGSTGPAGPPGPPGPSGMVRGMLCNNTSKREY